MVRALHLAYCSGESCHLLIGHVIAYRGDCVEVAHSRELDLFNSASLSL